MRVLLVWPSMPNSFWSFRATVKMLGFQSSLPPLGLITLAALCPPHWDLRLVDENIEDVTDAHILWSDMVFVSAMEVQQAAVARILARARGLGRRTVIGGPYASSHPDELQRMADHVVIGEPEEVFAGIAVALEAGTALPLYRVEERPAVASSPCPRFDLLQHYRYSIMAVQFSRGCPFQCDFCDIISIYGRKPRTKSPEQLIAELDRLYDLGWRGETFLVDDNFIGNNRKALELCQALEVWQKKRGYPFAFFTEASINLAQLPDLLDAMGRANFHYVFIGIETPSEEALQQAHKHQNLGQSLLDSVRIIQRSGLWVLGGFIVGFDADQDASIFQRQLEFIECADIPWAMAGLLQAPRNTPLHARLQQEGRLHEGEHSLESNFLRPNFQTKMPERELLTGYSRFLGQLYQTEAFYARTLRSLESWTPHPAHKSPRYSLAQSLRAVFGALWHQSILSPARASFRRTLLRILWRWRRHPEKINMGFRILVSAHHLVPFSKEIQRSIQASLEASERQTSVKDQETPV